MKMENWWFCWNCHWSQLSKRNVCKKRRRARVVSENLNWRNLEKSIIGEELKRWQALKLFSLEWCSWCRGVKQDLAMNLRQECNKWMQGGWRQIRLAPCCCFESKNDTDFPSFQSWPLWMAPKKHAPLLAEGNSPLNNIPRNTIW